MKIYQAYTTSRAVDLTAKLVAKEPRDIDKPCYVFCESKASLSYERAIVAETGGTFNVEVLSFSRYVAKNVNVEKYLSKSSAALVVRKLMNDNADSLMRIKPNSFNVPSEIYELISQLKAAMVTPADIDRVLEAEGGNTFGLKLKDVNTVYKAYEDFLLREGLTDESNFLSLMPTAVANDGKIKGAKVIVSGIQSFTRQTVEIIKALAKYCDVDFVTVSSNFTAYTHEGMNKITDCFKSAPVVDDEAPLTSEQRAIASGLFEPRVFANTGLYSDKVHIFEVANVKAECDTVAKRIRYEVVNNGLRYKDFVVCLGDVQSYEPILRERFALYDIPLFADVKRGLDSHPVMRLISGLLDTRKLNFLPKTAVALAKCGLFCSNDEAFTFERYCISNAVSRKTMKAQFTDGVAEAVRSKIADCIGQIPTKATVREYVSVLESLFEKLGVEEKCEILSQKLSDIGERENADFNDGGIKALKTLFEEIKNYLGDQTVSLADFKLIIVGAMQSVEISPIPEYNDNVFVGDYKSASQRTSKILFAIGMTNAVPYSKSDVALLNDRELLKMDGYKLVIEPKLEIVNKRERENITIALASFTDGLYVTYPQVDCKGNPVVKSEIIEYLVKIFGIKVKSLDGSESSSESEIYNYMSEKSAAIRAAEQSEEFRERKTVDKTVFSSYLKVIDDDTHDKITKLIQSNDESELFNADLKYDGKFSPTAIEKYFDCPYKAFAANVLRLSDTDTGETKVYELGNILHSVLENFAVGLDDVTSESEAKSLCDKCFDEVIKAPVYARYLNKSQYNHIFELLKNEAEKECLKVYREFTLSDFKILGAEVYFGKDSSSGLKPITLDTACGKINVSGKIDRVDTWGKYFRIIDYKSGSVDANPEPGLFTGRKLQLFLYLNVLMNEGKKPAGAYYYKLSDDFCSDGTDGIKLCGKTLEDAEVATHADKTLEETTKSELLDITIKNGAVNSKISTLDESQFENYAKYALAVAENGAEEMLEGCVAPSPFKIDDRDRNSCKYCEYKGLCGYDIELGSRTRELEGVKKQTLDAVKDEVEKALNLNGENAKTANCEIDSKVEESDLYFDENEEEFDDE